MIRTPALSTISAIVSVFDRSEQPANTMPTTATGAAIRMIFIASVKSIVPSR